MAKYNDPKSGKTVEAKNIKEAKELMKPKKKKRVKKDES